MLKKRIGYDVSSQRAIGICHNKAHRGYISAAAMKEHDCVNRNCNYFEKIETAGYWQQKEIAKKHREARKILMQSNALIRTDKKNIKLVINAKEEGGVEMITALTPTKDMLIIGHGNRIEGEDIGIKKTVEKYRGNGVKQSVKNTNTEKEDGESEDNELGARRNRVITGNESGGKRNKYENKKQSNNTYTETKNNSTKESKVVDRTEVKEQEQIAEKYEEFGTALDSILKDVHGIIDKTAEEAEAEIEYIEETGIIEECIPLSKESAARIKMYASIKLCKDVNRISIVDVVEMITKDKEPKFTFSKLFGDDRNEMSDVLDYMYAEYNKAKDVTDRFEKIIKCVR